jgi:signal transduction histidine kinase
MALLLGLTITLTSVVIYAWYIGWQLSGLRAVQMNLVDRNRKDSLQLLRIQNNLNSLAVAMRDMLDNDEPYPLAAWTTQFQRIRADLDDAFRQEAQVVVGRRTAEQQEFLGSCLAQFWDASDRVFALAANGHDKDARDEIRLSLQARLAALNTAVARLLVENNETEEQTTVHITEIYNRVQRHSYIFLAGALAAILVTSLFLIRSNRRLFREISSLSEQRSELAQKLISTQESTLRHVSRELHDEFGQVLTAIGSMLTRVSQRTPQESAWHADLVEVRDIAQAALDDVRTLSQVLHPVILDEAGLESTLDWYVPRVSRQTGVPITYVKSGTPFEVESGHAIHIYRVVQEALNNLSRHSGASEGWLRLNYLPDVLQVEVEDHGTGFLPATNGNHRGIGMVAMRERAHLIGGVIEFARPSGGGTIVRLTVPRNRVECVDAR